MTQEKKNNIKLNLALCLGVLSMALNVWLLLFHNTARKIAYVRSSELVYGYLGMQEAHRGFEEKSRIYQANIDTLQKDYQLAFSQYSRDAVSLRAGDKAEKEKILMRQQESLVNYAQSINNKMKEEEQKSTEGVLNQINSFVEEYGKQRGYDIILGTTLSGSLLYGDEAIDITKEVLDELNHDYKGGSK